MAKSRGLSIRSYWPRRKIRLKWCFFAAWFRRVGKQPASRAVPAGVPLKEGRFYPMHIKEPPSRPSRPPLKRRNARRDDTPDVARRGRIDETHFSRGRRGRSHATSYAAWVSAVPANILTTRDGQPRRGRYISPSILTANTDSLALSFHSRSTIIRGGWTSKRISPFTLTFTKPFT